MLEVILEFLRKILFFTGYFTNGSYPRPLSATEEKQCIEDMQKGDVAAREKLICHNMRLVAHIAKKYGKGNDLDDLISIGSIGLIKGVESFSFSKGTNLATYLARCIENEILMSLRSNKRYQNTVHLQEQLGTDNEGNEYTLMDVLSINEESVFKKVELSILKDKLLELIDKTLSQREKEIILLRYGLTGEAPLTQLQTARKLNISRSYISRIETRSLSKIRERMNDLENW